ncbi:MAG: hypothetical protein GX228_07655 [Firmicutes bacterium]|jgi:hypothetical protein|nr:hypothetical protein [Bacillota bacterium]NLL88786.1 hypothetical protein [Bacillota bacterium]HKM16678.1 hypothetical protein [Limnochordia bacterium]
MKKAMLFVGMLCLLLASGASALAAYEAPKVAAPLTLGSEWPVVDEKAYSAFDGDAGWKVWLFWNDENVYLQYDVYTDFPMGNQYDEHQIWNADSIEFEVTGAGQKEKWIIALTSNGYQIVTRQPRTIVTPGEGVTVLIVETDFGYRGQVVFDRTHPHMAKFPIETGFVWDMAVQVNDSKDGLERTRILGEHIGKGTYYKLTFVD